MEDRVAKLKCTFIPCVENAYRPEILRRGFLYYYAGLLIALKILMISFLLYLPTSNFFADITKASLFNLTNDARVQAGEAPLNNNSELDKAALLKAEDMLANGYFSHVSPTGITPWYWFKQAGYDYRYAGENLAIGFVDSSEVNQAWLNSPTHRANILNPKFSDIGFAVVRGEFQGAETTIVVQLFGTAQTAPAVVLSNSSPPAAAQPVAQKTPAVSSATTGAESAPAQETAANAPASQTAAVAGNNATAQGHAEEVLSAYTEAPVNQSFGMKIFSFLNSGYNNLLQEIIYGSLAFIILMLLITVAVDIFAYRAYEIQYKGIFLKAVVLCALFVILLFADKGTIVSLIPHNLGIY